MESGLIAPSTNSVTSVVKITINSKQSIKPMNGNEPIIENIISEGGYDFFQYIKKMGFKKGSNIMVLSSIYYYYYNSDDLAGINTLVNVKMLNHMKHLDSFLCTLVRILPFKADYIGCFKENYMNGGMVLNKPEKSYRVAKNILDSGINRKLTKKFVWKILEDHGFKVTNMTDINGKTYFSTQVFGNCI